MDLSLFPLIIGFFFFSDGIYFECRIKLLKLGQIYLSMLLLQFKITYEFFNFFAPYIYFIGTIQFGIEKYLGGNLEKIIWIGKF